jgi:hypothetical protein
MSSTVSGKQVPIPIPIPNAESTSRGRYLTLTDCVVLCVCAENTLKHITKHDKLDRDTDLRELIGVQQPAVGGDEGVELLVLVQHPCVLRHGDVALLKGGGGDLRETRERAAPGLEADVQRVPDHEHDDGDEHGDGGDPEPPAPAHVVLDVHHHRQRQQRRHPHREEVEVEVAPLALRHLPGRLRGDLLLPGLAVELVGAERHDAGPQPAGADGRAQEGEVQRGELPPGGALARGRGAGARRGAERREERGHDEAEHAELVEDGAGDDGPEAAREGVGGERAQDGREAGRAAEVGQQVGRLHQRQVQLLRQVRDHVGAEAGRGEPVADVVPCNPS